MAPQFIEFKSYPDAFAQGYNTFGGLDEVFNRAIQMGLQSREASERVKMLQRQQQLEEQRFQINRTVQAAQLGFDPGSISPDDMTMAQSGGAMLSRNPNAVGLQEYLQQQKRTRQLSLEKEQTELNATNARGGLYGAQAEYFRERPTGPKAPNGFMWNADNSSLVPIPGGPAEQSMVSAAETKLQAAESVKAHSADVIRAADSALDAIGMSTTGITGAAMSKIPGTKRVALEGYIDTLKSNLAFERLQEMRNQSKTGGALGQVSDNELRLLSSVVASLNPNLPKNDLRKNITRVRDQYQKILTKLQSAPKASKGADPLGIL